MMNEKFNGTGCTNIKFINESLVSNQQEIVFIATVDELPVGFCCVQLFKSMCYSQNYAEITELYVDDLHRRTGIAMALMQTIEEYFKNETISGYQLFTGGSNFSAQSFYEKIGYLKTNEIMYRKRR